MMPLKRKVKKWINKRKNTNMKLKDLKIEINNCKFYWIKRKINMKKIEN